MRKNIVPIIFVALILIAGLVMVLTGNKKTSGSSTTGSELVYFWGDGCPHCSKVDEFATANNLSEKVTYDKKEVWKDTGNAKLMNDKVADCKIDSSEAGVPLLYDGSEKKCYIGDTDVIAYFQKRLDALK